MIKKSIFLILCLIFLSFLAFAEDGVIAIVNDQIITQKDLNDFINFMRMQMSPQLSGQDVEQRINKMQPDLINRLIEDRLILQAAYKENIIVDQNRIKARIEQIRRKYPSEADFQDLLADQGLSLADIELRIKEQLLMVEMIDKRIKSKIVVRPKEVTDYYNAHSKDFSKPEQRLTRFLIIDQAMVSEIEASIAEYKDLDAIAQCHSLEITELGWVTSGQLKEEIGDIVFDLEAGGLSPVLNSDGRFYIFEVKAIRPSGTQPLFDVQEEVSHLLFSRKMQEAMVEWLEELRSEAYIEIKEVESSR